MFDVALKSAGAQVVLATSSDGNHPPENIIDGYGFIINIFVLIQYINGITFDCLMYNKCFNFWCKELYTIFHFNEVFIY